MSSSDGLLQAGVPLLEAGITSMQSCFELIETAVEKAAYGSTLVEPHRGKAQASCQEAKGLVADKQVRSMHIVLQI